MPRDVNSAVSQSPRLSDAPSKFAGMRVHFIGIGGCGMSGLAAILLDSGAIVSGSEPNPNAQTFALGKRGATLSRDQMGELLSRDVNLVVRTAAVPDTNREYLAARAFGIRTIKYADLLGEIMAERFGVAVAGTHGKSTTTAMIAYALMQCGVDPSFVVGGTVPQLGGGSHSGTGASFVAEACEFDRSFHHLSPRVAIITNIEEDHLDCYKDIDEIVESFRKFAALVPDDGLIIAGGNDPRVIEALAGIEKNIELAALAEGFAWSTRPIGIENGCHVGEVLYKGEKVCALRPALPGEHNLLNATMALAACRACGVEPQKAALAIAGFTGVDRRMMPVGKINGAIVVDDYGHHPTEIRATLKALRERYQPARLICVFQPHQHSRTRFLLDDFARSFAAADETIVPDIYFVRDSEAERQRVSADDLVERIKDQKHRAQHLPKFDQIVAHLRAQARPGDLIVTMGAGNVWEIGRDLVLENAD
ncbi:UDP-N-acetylmuramate--L-alanine ligase [soil metagenome]